MPIEALLESTQIETKMKDIILRLAKRTERQQQPWEQSAPGTFEAKFGVFRIVLNKTAQSRTTAMYTLGIYNEDNALLEEAVHYTGTGMYPVLGDLHNAVRRQALKAEEALDKLLQLIGD